MSDQHPVAASLRRESSRHSDRVATARRDLALHHRDLTERAASLQETLDEIRPPFQRYRISRRMEMWSLTALGVAEVVVADTVVQALALTPIATELVAVGVGGAATGLAWLVGHEWAISHDPQAAAAGRRGWLRLAGVTAGVFLAANLGVRIYYGILAEQANQLGNGFVAPLLSGVLLTVVTGALMVVAAFVSAHAETGKEAQLRKELSRTRAELRSLENRIGVLRASPARSGLRSIADKEGPPTG
jgi:uncharacterized integral membrane protein